MEWLKINKSNLPENEVLAANFSKGTYGYRDKLVGYLGVDSDDDIYCDSGGDQMLENCTHYIDIHKWDI